MPVSQLDEIDGCVWIRELRLGAIAPSETSIVRLGPNQVSMVLWPVAPGATAVRNQIVVLNLHNRWLQVAVLRMNQFRGNPFVRSLLHPIEVRARVACDKLLIVPSFTVRRQQIVA